MVMVGPEIASGSCVRLRLNSVVCPDAEQINEKITNNLEVTGRVLFLSDAGKHKGHYAVVEVGGIISPLVVPVSQMEVFDTEQQNKIARE